MKHNLNFKEISARLKEVSDFLNPNFSLEQYCTPISVLEHFFNLFPTESNKTVIDLGIGTGKLATLADLLGSTNIIGIDIDPNALNLSRTLEIKNLSLIRSSVEFLPLKNFQFKINGVIMNPPFGTKRKYMDLVFLKKALETKGWIISLHKYNEESYQKIQSLLDENHYYISNKQKLTLNLPKTYKIHTKFKYSVEVILILSFPNI